MKHHIFTINDFMVDSVANTVFWDTQTVVSVAPMAAFTVDMTPSGAYVTAHTASIASAANSFSANSTVAVASVNTAFSIRLTSITNGDPELVVYAISSQNPTVGAGELALRAGFGWTVMNAGDTLSATLGTTTCFGVYKGSQDNQVALVLHYLPASGTWTSLGTLTFT